MNKISGPEPPLLASALSLALLATSASAAETHVSASANGTTHLSTVSLNSASITLSYADLVGTLTNLEHLAELPIVGEAPLNGLHSKAALKNLPFRTMKSPLIASCPIGILQRTATIPMKRNR